MNATMRIAFYPGCSANSTCSELLDSTRAVAGRLELELVELRSATCTGSRSIRAADAELFVTLNIRIIALAEQAGLDLMTICNTCTLNLLDAKKRVDEHAGLRERVNQRLASEGLRYTGTARITHFLWYLLDDYGEERLRRLVVNPLTGHSVAAFYGCHIVRPPAHFGFVDSRNVRSIERLATLLGCQPIDYSGRTECCGFHCAAENETVPVKLSGRHVVAARTAGADAMVTPCPLCHTVLDTFQQSMEHDLATPLDMPVLHLPQLVGLALGLDRAALGLERHAVPVPARLGRVIPIRSEDGMASR
jgi:succinate dehydrogenase / fumarate reductase cytochrome b subunit